MKQAQGYVRCLPPHFPATLRGGRTTTEAAQQHLGRPLLPVTGPRRGRRMLSYTRASLSQEEEAEERQLNLEASLATETTGLTDGYCALCTSLQVAPHSGVLAFVRLRLPELRPLESEGFGDRDMFALATRVCCDPHPKPLTLSLPLTLTLTLTLSLPLTLARFAFCDFMLRESASAKAILLDHANPEPHPHPHPRPQPHPHPSPYP